jgi:hypothetical protein
MPGVPKECFDHAANCRQIAAQVSNPAVRRHFLHLASMWEILGRELEGTQALLAGVEDMEKQPPPR